MSRTYKDKPYKFVDPESRWDYGMDKIAYVEYIDNFQYLYNRYYYIERGGIKTKKKRSYNEHNWMTTPMWWIREYMNQPQRIRGKEWERQIIKVNIDELIDQDIPDVSRKPHLYYW